jgi:hypothetical protein
MKRITCSFVVTLLFALFFGCATGGLTSSRESGVGPIKMNAPYANTVQYCGYISKKVNPDGVYKGKKAYYLYFWVPAVIEEVGVAMYSPADKEPGKDNFRSSNFESDYKADKEKFFDTFIALEKMSIFDPSKIQNGGSVMSLLVENDDSSEMKKNPGGQKYNSLLRHTSDTSSPLKALVRGVYRITLTSFRGDVEGSFIATVGTNIPGVKIASNLQDLHKLVNDAK